MNRRIATGIDIGTHHVKMVVVEEVADKNGRSLRILGTGSAPARGMRQGYVIDKDEAAASVRAARHAAEHMARIPIKKGFLSIGSVSMEDARATGEAIISRADQEVTELDIETALKAARKAAAPAFTNRRVLHEIPLEYRVDGAKTYGDPFGMRGTRLEVDFLFVTCLSTQIDALIEVVEAADIEIIDQMASPLAGSYIMLTNDQKMRGCLLANIGAETVSIVVYDEGIPLSVRVFPTGSAQVTDDLALAFKIPIEDAERVKLGRLGGAMYPRKKIDDIVAGRLTKILQLIEKHLKTIGHRRPLPAGIILSGGGSGTTAAIDLARKTLALPARLGELPTTGSAAARATAHAKMRDSSWAVAYGLALWGLTGDMEAPRQSHALRLGTAVHKFFRQFLP